MWLLTYMLHCTALRWPRGDARVDNKAGCECNFLQTCASGELAWYDLRFDNAASVRCRWNRLSVQCDHSQERSYFDGEYEQLMYLLGSFTSKEPLNRGP